MEERESEEMGMEMIGLEGLWYYVMKVDYDTITIVYHSMIYDMWDMDRDMDMDMEMIRYNTIQYDTTTCISGEGDHQLRLCLSLLFPFLSFSFFGSNVGSNLA